MRAPLIASYDFVAFTRRGDLDLVADVESRVTAGPGSAGDRDARDGLAQKLRDLHPSLEPYRLAVDVDLGPHAPVRLSSAEERGSVHLALHDDHVMIGLPYWPSERGTRVTLRHAWEYLKLIRRERRHDVYDVQEERLVDLTHDFEGVVASYLRSSRRVREHFAPRANAPRA
jgi:hypothetical protein